jgi:hypothetical protein
MKLNPAVWGADNVRDLVKTVKLNLSSDPADHAEADRITREADERAKSQEG